MDQNVYLVIAGAVGALATKVFDYFMKKDDMKMTQSEKLRAEFKADLAVIQADVSKWQAKYFEAYDNFLRAQNNNNALQEKYNLVQEKFNIVTEKHNNLQTKYDALVEKVKVLEGQAAGLLPSTPLTPASIPAVEPHIITSTPAPTAG